MEKASTGLVALTNTGTSSPFGNTARQSLVTADVNTLNQRPAELRCSNFRNAAQTSQNAVGSQPQQFVVLAIVQKSARISPHHFESSAEDQPQPEYLKNLSFLQP